MAIYSCNLASVGRTTHAAGTAGAHLRYICRADAAPVVEAHGISIVASEARTWMDREEADDRANARVLDKVRVALPRELTPEQRAELVREFCRAVTGDRVPWMFAIHQEGKDANNPHAHIVIRDRDLESGRRVLKLSDSPRDREKAGLEPKAVEWIRAQWERQANQALERAGIEARIDRRSLEAQGIDRQPTIHIGPRAMHVHLQVHRPDSKVVTDGRGRQIDYPMIDAGRTRLERQHEIIDLNLERAARSPDFETREWAKFERTQRAADRVLENELTIDARRRTLEERRLKAHFKERLATLRQERSHAYQTGIGVQKAVLSPALAQLRDRHERERAQLDARQHRLVSRVVAALDFTGGVRRSQAVARATLKAAHIADRRSMAVRAKDARQALQEGLKRLFDPRRAEIESERRGALSALKERHSRSEASADARRQLREGERERGRTQVAEAIRTMTALNRNRVSDVRPPPSPALAKNQDQVRAAFACVAASDAAEMDRRRDAAERQLAEQRRYDHGPSR